MIPVLFDYDATTFSTNGIARLVDCISCVVTEGRNDIYELEFTYPINGIHFADIQEGRIVVVTHDNTGDLQPFDIYKSSKTIEGVVTFNAHHISYRLNEIPVAPFSASSCVTALAAISDNSMITNPFTFWTNKVVTKDYEVTVPSSARSLLGGEENSILDVFGTGEYEFDQFDVNLYAQRGSASGLEIRYGKNLVEYDNETDYADVVNGVVPYWTGENGAGSEVTVTPTDPVMMTGVTLYNNRDVVIPLDMSDAFESAPTEAQLITAAESYLTANAANIPAQSIDIEFVELWQTNEYEQFAQLQTLQLCDTLTVTYPDYGFISVSAKVVTVEFNVLADRYDKITLGSIPTTLGDAITARTESQIEKLAGEVKGFKTIAGNTNQFFWHTESGDDTGTHITETPQAEFLADPESGGPNLIARSNGIAVREGLDELAQFGTEVVIGRNSEQNVLIDNTGVTIRDGQVALAKFGSNVVIGQEDGFHIELESSGVGAELGFYQDEVEVAYITDQQLYINNATLNEVLRIGPLVWQVRSATRVSLRYSPE